MKQWKLLAISLLGISLLSGCATTVKMQVKRAPELDLKDVKTVSVKDFSVNGNLNLDLFNKKKGLMGAVTSIAADVGSNELAKRHHDEIKTLHRNGLKNALFSNGYFKVSDGDNSQATIGGNINYNVSDEFIEETHKDEKGKTTKFFTLERKAKVSINMQVTDKSGTIIGSKTLSTTKGTRASGLKKGDAREKTEEWHKIVNKAVQSLQENSVRKIAPYYVWESRKLAEADAKIIEKGNDAASDGDWERAVSFWEEARDSGSTKDKAAALYNLSIHDEKQGQLNDALEKLKLASSLVDEDDYRVQIRTIERRIRESEQLSGK